MLIADDNVMKQLLRESPQGLIKFQMYSKKDEQRFTDRRLNRIKNKNTIPLGPWAHTVIEGIAITKSVLKISVLFTTRVWKVCESRLPFFHFATRSKDAKLHDDLDNHKFHCFGSPGR